MSGYSYSGFVALATLAHADHPDWRWGQAVFNTLHETRPDLSEQVRGTAIDPFYEDKPAFWDWLRDNWDSTTSA